MKLSLPLIDSCEGCGSCCAHMRTPPFIGFYVNRETREPYVKEGGHDPYGDVKRFFTAPEEAKPSSPASSVTGRTSHPVRGSIR